MTQADLADRFRCYQLSVQSPEADLDFICARFAERRARQPCSLREDFCGTALLSSVWLERGERNTTVCVDIDPEPLAWGRRHNFSHHTSPRASFLCADVLDARTERVDVACAMNFSFCALKQRTHLQQYFDTVARHLEPEGVFFCELYGGTEAIVPIEERREVDDFTLVWEQATYNPITSETRCHIHFEFADGSRLERAFTYDWRLWSIAEVDEMLRGAGFTSVDIYWEAVDDSGEGTGDYRLTTEEENQEGWLVIIVAAR